MKERRNEKKCCCKKGGFTLAEVLITLVIIGVIGALTVPSLIQNTQKQEYVSALKKAYSILSQAAQQIIMEEGSPKGDEGWVNGEDKYDLFKKHLNVIKDCGTAAGCIKQKKFKYLHSSGGDNWEDDSRFYKLILADGMQAAFALTDKNCSSGGYAVSSNCGMITVDVNGEKKPNQYGRDVYTFVLKENGIYPGGMDNPDTACSWESGASCAAKVLAEGAINF